MSLLEQVTNNYLTYTSFLLKIQKFYTHCLYENPAALDYVLSRGISREYIDFYKLGLSPGISKLQAFLALNNLSDDFLRTLKVVLVSEGRSFDPLTDRIIFPLDDILGNTVGFSGRIWTREQEVLYTAKATPKYINTASSDIFAKSLLLYNLKEALPYIKQEGYCIIVEGMMDAISFFIYGIRNVIAPCGTSFTDEHALLLKYATDKAIILYDQDDAGNKSSFRVYETLTNHAIQTTIASLPIGDPDSFVRQYGKDTVLQHISTSSP